MGHRAHMSERPFKYLVIADGSEESRLASYFAARRARHTNAKVALMAVLEPSGFHHWLGVGAEMAREDREEAERRLEDLASEVIEETGDAPEFIIREGEVRACLREVVEADRDVRILVLGAAHGSHPGPLVQALVRGRGLFGARAIPVAVVPASITREEIRDLA